jgi:thiol oxidase
MELIEAIQGYVFNFFGCHDCSKNFRNETAEYEDEIKESTDDIMYLWDGKAMNSILNHFNQQMIKICFQVHNQVNYRLAGDPTEDPKHPKIPFPSMSKCPKCRLNDTGFGDIVVFSNEEV